ncbi:MAG: methylenetetrahydrofolate reductase C-terminal domain-containing protein, partial [Candidatus Sumerlaeia bacterium]|nr:methylenetetrahydrofolate reductase C-terminal domain-containing protein [Candidatus Sumerlaeia bacterium]
MVTNAFMEKLKSETPEDAIKRSAQQLAMFRALGYNGADIGNCTTLEQILQIVDESLKISDWQTVKDNISFPPQKTESPQVPRPPLIMEYLHNLAFEKNGALFKLSKQLLMPAEKSFQQNQGFLYRSFLGLEQFIKGTLFECRLCGDCFLPEDYFVCTQGGCEKGLPNPPCGDPTPEGRCGNNEKRLCAAEIIYVRAARKKELPKLKQNIFDSRDTSLAGTSSILNHFFGRSHSLKATLLERSGLIQIAEMLHASIPTVAPAMFYLKELGEAGFTSPNRGLNLIVDLIISQANCLPAYIDINIDALGESAPLLIRHFVRQIKRYGRGVPVCVDSSNPEVLRAGLEEWYANGTSVPPPLINSINYAELDKTRP